MEHLSTHDIAEIETKTGFDVLNESNFDIDIIDRAGDDGKVITIDKERLNLNQLIRKINNL